MFCALVCTDVGRKKEKQQSPSWENSAQTKGNNAIDVNCSTQLILKRDSVTVRTEKSGEKKEKENVKKNRS